MSQVDGYAWQGHFTFEWPPQQLSHIFTSEDGPKRLVVSADADGCVYIDLSEKSGRQISSYRTQRLNLVGEAEHIILAEYRNGVWRVIVDKYFMREFQDPNDVLTITATHPSPISRLLSFRRHDSQQSCQGAIAKRSARFSQPEKLRTRHARRPKSTSEQYDDLMQAMLCLNILSHRISQGETYLTGHLATELRALLFFDKETERDGYDPLLLRVAHLKGVGLPVYACPTTHLPSLNQLDHHFTSNTPELLQTGHKQEPLDLQDWLTIPLIFYKVDGKMESINGKDFISEVANATGCAHYDTTVTAFADLLKALKGASGTTYLDVTLCQIANTSICLAKWLLDEDWRTFDEPT